MDRCAAREEPATVPVLVACTAVEPAEAQRAERAADASCCSKAVMCSAPQPASAAGEGELMRALQPPAEHAVDTHVGDAGMLPPTCLSTLEILLADWNVTSQCSAVLNACLFIGGWGQWLLTVLQFDGRTVAIT